MNERQAYLKSAFYKNDNNTVSNEEIPAKMKMGQMNLTGFAFCYNFAYSFEAKAKGLRKSSFPTHKNKKQPTT